jgi:hypothetical protein
VHELLPLLVEYCPAGQGWQVAFSGSANDPAGQGPRPTVVDRIDLTVPAVDTNCNKGKTEGMSNDDTHVQCNNAQVVLGGQSAGRSRTPMPRAMPATQLGVSRKASSKKSTPGVSQLQYVNVTFVRTARRIQACFTLATGRWEERRSRGHQHGSAHHDTTHAQNFGLQPAARCE